MYMNMVKYGCESDVLFQINKGSNKRTENYYERVRGK